MQRRRRDYTLRECERLRRHRDGASCPRPWSARVDVFRRVDLEAANLREVLGGCLADGDAETGLRICTAIRPVWIVRGAFAEGAAWLDAFLQLPGAAIGARVGARAGAGQPRAAGPGHGIGARPRSSAAAGLELCWAAGEQFWVAAALNLLTEIALHAGQT